MKANWDAALDQKEGKMGVGIVIRDEHGEVLAAMCGQRHHVHQATTAEILALWRAMEICNDLNLRRVVFEGDAQVVIKGINEDNEDFLDYGMVIVDAKKLIKLIKDWKVQYTHRSTNEVAHILAKNALKLDSEQIWIEEFPNCIAQVLERYRRCIDNNFHQ
ncbi:uncharacterized protein LOC121239461 [Juglans microcarpa x Juglans regia]|uniref:uncharacterized protein LOC121239461 n=1 Tax=Juglans microcarpa x Juglans regia TaxID=2249226 RepID=UPI001B7F7680|nr:uncharacterized protein LOC121239461 [Juglans microcarpa x Juglans regia]